MKESETKIRKSKIKKSVSKKDIIFNGCACLLTSFILALMMKAAHPETAGSSGFLNAETFKDIGVLTAVYVITISVMLFYIFISNREKFSDIKTIVMLYTALTLTYAVCLIFGKFVSPYLAPLMLSAMLAATLIDKKVGLVLNILTSQIFFLSIILVSGDAKASDTLSALISATVSGILMIIAMDKAKTRIKFIFISIVIGAASAAIAILLGLLSLNLGAKAILENGLWSFLSSLLSVGLFMLILPVMEYVFERNSIFRIAEIASLETPLLKRLAKEAPGTFHHSLVVGNLAELCAAAIGESSMLAKAASYYHDVGKLKNPEFFIENQKGYNPHDDLIPEVSVRMIKSHTQDGYEFIKEAHLPDVIANVALEHHGTMPVNYFLYKAQNLTEEDVDREDFSYSDPKPSSKIAAIVMIADTVEAATRASSNSITDEKEWRAFIHKLIKEKTDLNQFSECDVTFKDLQMIEDTLAEVVPKLYHSRILYSEKGKE